MIWLLLALHTCWSGARRAADSGKLVGTAWGRMAAMRGTLPCGTAVQRDRGRVVEMECHGRGAVPMHVLMCCLGGGGRKIRIEARWFHFAFSSHCSVSHYQTVIYTNLSFDESVLLMVVIGE